MMDIENWDYLKMCRSESNFWNTKPLGEQLEILRKHYPIGMKLEYYHVDRDDNRIQLEYSKTKGAKAQIISHFLYESGDQPPCWWILRIKNNKEAFDVKGNEFEHIHIGFLMPDTQEIRNSKLKEIGI